jgi:uncharacterized membrane protein YbhN (UPF0104 family)
MVPFRALIDNTSAAFLLILVVLSTAATGARWAGVIAAVAGTPRWAIFLTQPYHQVTITPRSDV